MKTSCDELNVGPGVVEVTFGKTMVSVVTTIITDNVSMMFRGPGRHDRVGSSFLMYAADERQDLPNPSPQRHS